MKDVIQLLFHILILGGPVFPLLLSLAVQRFRQNIPRWLRFVFGLQLCIQFVAFIPLLKSLYDTHPEAMNYIGIPYFLGYLQIVGTLLLIGIVFSEIRDSMLRDRGREHENS